MDAGLQQVDGHRCVILVRDADDRRVDVRDGVAMIAIAARDAEPVRDVLEAICRRIHDGDGFHTAGARERRQVNAFGGRPGSDYADTDRSHDSAAFHWGACVSANRS